MYRIKYMMRNKERSLLLAFISFIFVSFVFLYIDSIERNYRALEDLGKQMPVSICLTDVSGIRQQGLRIREETVDRLGQLDVKDKVLTAESYGNVSANGQDGKKISVFLTASNDASAFLLEPESLSVGMEEFQELLSGDDGKCLMSKEYAKERGLDCQKGDTLELNLYSGKYNEIGQVDGFEKVISTQIEIGGFFQGQVYDSIAAKEPNVICPVEWLRSQYAEAGKQFYFSSVRGTVGNPLQLNDWKAKAKKLAFAPVNSQQPEDISRIALSVDDRNYIQTASKIRKNMEILKVFMVPVFVLLVFLEALVFFLSIHNQKREMFLMRCLGIKRFEIILQLLLEGSLLATIGSVTAMVVLLCAGYGFPAGTWVKVFLSFLVVQLVGSLFSAIVSCGRNVMHIGKTY
ncbi:hypothetical protein C806_04651 [Lachnospiraceae bacterium 3-1]|nr:hypothetical protein C806_04651 [Lachnospiraceae bacterium 3-1]